jgi:hypothetical protein
MKTNQDTAKGIDTTDKGIIRVQRVENGVCERHGHHNHPTRLDTPAPVRTTTTTHYAKKHGTPPRKKRKRVALRARVLLPNCQNSSRLYRLSYTMSSSQCTLGKERLVTNTNQSRACEIKLAHINQSETSLGPTSVRSVDPKSATTVTKDSCRLDVSPKATSLFHRETETIPYRPGIQYNQNFVTLYST